MAIIPCSVLCVGGINFIASPQQIIFGIAGVLVTLSEEIKY